MVLTGPATLALAAALTLAAMVTTVALWERVRPPRVRQILYRVGLLGISQVAALALAGVAANDYGGFFDSWSQVGETVVATAHRDSEGESTRRVDSAQQKAAPIDSIDPDQPTAADRASATSGRDFELPTEVGTAPDGGSWRTLTWSHRQDWPRDGAVVLTRLAGSSLSEWTYVYLPPQYFAGLRDLPVLEVFTGYPGRTDNLVNRMHVPDAMRSGIRSCEIAPAIAVLTRPGVTGAWDTECTDVPDGPQAFTFYSRVVPAAARARFGLSAGPTLALGDSTGGYCAAKMAMLDPRDFGAAVEMSGYYEPAVDKTTRGMFDEEKLRRRNDLGWVLRHRRAPRTTLLIATARDDDRAEDGYAVAQRWYRLVVSPMRAERLVLPHGGHDFVSFDRQLRFDLSWLTGRQPGSHTRLASAPSDAKTPDAKR